MLLTAGSLFLACAERTHKLITKCRLGVARMQTALNKVQGCISSQMSSHSSDMDIIPTGSM
eukprot:2584281-Amphidinium_carterae.1